MTQAEQIYNKHECAKYDKSTGEFRPNTYGILAAIQEALDSFKDYGEKDGLVTTDDWRKRAYGNALKVDQLSTQLAAKEKELREAYDYILQKSGAHFMQSKKLWTAHITLGYDYQRYGETEHEAKDALAACLSRKPHIREFIHQNIHR